MVLIQINVPKEMMKKIEMIKVLEGNTTKEETILHLLFSKINKITITKSSSDEEISMSM